VTALAIEAIGAFTAVGKNGPETMGSLLSRVQLFDDLDLKGATGEPMTGAMTPIPKRVTGVERLFALAFYAVEDCVAAAPPSHRRLPLILSTPVLDDDQATALLSSLAAEASLQIDLPSSRVIARGRQSAPVVLAEARAMILSRRSEACLVAGVDSLVEPARLEPLVAAGRVRDGVNLDGFTPGEASACLMLARARPSHGGAFLLGLGAADERGRWHGEPPITGAGLGSAFRAALADAGTSAADLAYIAHDISGQHAAFEELALALGRLPARQSDAEVWGPATCIGETGAAAGFVSLAMLAFYVAKGVLAGPALASLVSEGGVRGAAVIAPRPRVSA
jgi:3-oxoacyl-[acyl-carrier-protein] synthase I